MTREPRFALIAGNGRCARALTWSELLELVRDWRILYPGSSLEALPYPYP